MRSAQGFPGLGEALVEGDLGAPAEVGEGFFDDGLVEEDFAGFVGEGSVLDEAGAAGDALDAGEAVLDGDDLSGAEVPGSADDVVSGEGGEDTAGDVLDVDEVAGLHAGGDGDGLVAGEGVHDLGDEHAGRLSGAVDDGGAEDDDGHLEGVPEHFGVAGDGGLAGAVGGRRVGVGGVVEAAGDGGELFSGAHEDESLDAHLAAGDHEVDGGQEVGLDGGGEGGGVARGGDGGVEVDDALRGDGADGLGELGGLVEPDGVDAGGEGVAGIGAAALDDGVDLGAGGAELGEDVAAEESGGSGDGDALGTEVGRRGGVGD